MKISLGIELGDEYFKIAVGIRKGAHLKLQECIFGAVQAFSDDEIGRAIASALKKTKYKTRFVVVSFPRNLVTVRNLHLPSSSVEEIEKMVSFHITRIVPHKIEDVIFGYCLSGADDRGYKRITLAIVHKETVKKQLKILDKAGFLVDRIVLSSYCVWRRIIRDCQAEIKQGELYIIIDVGSSFTEFTVFEKENLLFTRSIAVQAKEISDSGLTKLLGEAKQSLLVFQNEEINKRPQRIFLSGSGVIAGSLKETIEKELELPVTYVHPPSCDIGGEKGAAVADVSFSAVSNVIHSIGKEEGLSFVLPEITIRKSLREKIIGLVVMGSLIIYFLGIICFIFLGRIYSQRNYFDQLKDGYHQIEKDIGSLAQQLEKVEFVKGYLHSRKAHLYALNQFQRIMPENMALSKVQIGAQGKTILRGQVFQLSDVFRFVSSLEQVESFKDVKTKFARQGRWNDQTVTDFEIGFKLDMGLLVEQ